MDCAALQALAEGAARLGVPLAASQLARFSRYFELLVRWNARIKLTSVVDPAGVVEKHFLDSLAVVPALGDATELVDVGSGAGFPGLVVAAVSETLRVTAVESVGKKAAFLEAVRRELALPRVEVIADRMEELVAAGRRFDAAVSRATFAPAEWVRRGSDLVRPGGRLIAMVVPGADATPESVVPDWRTHFATARLEPSLPGRALLIFEGRTR